MQFNRENIIRMHFWEKFVCMPFVFQNHDGFLVVRGDLFPGGLKAKYLTQVLAEVREEEVVYAAHAYGHSGFALGLAGYHNRKKVTLFFAGPKVNTYILKQT